MKKWKVFKKLGKFKWSFGQLTFIGQKLRNYLPE